jgi:pimeloyl-ACP methyl ester carboxylesterase
MEGVDYLSRLGGMRSSFRYGIDYAYRDTGGHGGAAPLLLLQHFRGNLDSWDPALVDALARSRRVITVDYAGVGGSAGQTADTFEQTARDSIAFVTALGLAQVDLLGFSIGSFVAQEIALRRPAVVRRLVLASSAPKGAARHARLGARRHRRGRHAADQPGGIPQRVLRPLRGQPASGQGGTRPHVRAEGRPRPGDQLGHPRSAVRRGQRLGASPTTRRSSG